MDFELNLQVKLTLYNVKYFWRLQNQQILTGPYER